MAATAAGEAAARPPVERHSSSTTSRPSPASTAATQRVPSPPAVRMRAIPPYSCRREQGARPSSMGGKGWCRFRTSHAASALRWHLAREGARSPLYGGGSGGAACTINERTVRQQLRTWALKQPLPTVGAVVQRREVQYPKPGGCSCIDRHTSTHWVEHWAADATMT